MWSRLDDDLLTHPKVFEAGARLKGPDGGARALALFVLGLLWSNRHLSDGHLPRATVQSFPHVSKPIEVAAALVDAGLWEKNGSGFVIHDFEDYNVSGKAIKQRRKADRDRKRRARADA